MDFVHFKEIKLSSRPIPWRSAGGLAIDSGANIAAILKFLSSSTVTSPGDIPGVGNGGFKYFGDLTFLTEDDGAGMGTMVYKDIFLDEGGIEESLEDLDKILDHNTGTIRVPLTDIRAYYRSGGAFVQRVNYRLRSGRYEAASIDPKTKQPFSLLSVLKALFVQLPGNPFIVGDTAWAAGLKEPTVVGEGQPLVQVIQDLLDQNGLEAQLQPENHYVINRRGANSPSRKHYFQYPGHQVAGKYVAYEKKTVTVGDRPPAVCVLGLKRVRKITSPYVPVVLAENGRYYKLEDYLKAIQYPLDKFKRQVLTGHEKNFDDVPPDVDASASSALELDKYVLHSRRQDILATYGYKLYAPLFLFTGKKNAITSGASALGAGSSAASGAPDPFAGFPSFSDDDIDTCPYLPYVDTPIYKSAYNNLAKFAPDTKRERGDKEPIILSAPIVQARTIGVGMLADFETITKRFNALLTSTEKELEFLRDSLSWRRAGIVRVGVEMLFEERIGRSALRTALVLLDDDIRKVSDFAGQELHSEMTAASGSNIKLLYNMLSVRTGEILEIEKREVDIDGIKEKLKLKFKEFKTVYEKLGGQQLQRINLPHGPIFDGFRIDDTTGMVEFAKPACWMEEPFLFDGESSQVGAALDGGVVVTAAYEMDTNTFEDYTSMLYVPEDKDVNPRVSLAGICRPSPIAPEVIRHSEMRMYETELGVPMNINAAEETARPLAEGRLKAARNVTGYTTEYDGLLLAVLDGGTDSIQHVFNGDVGKTYISVNANLSKMPLGPAGMAPPINTDVVTSSRFNRASQ